MKELVKELLTNCNHTWKNGKCRKCRMSYELYERALTVMGKASVEMERLRHHEATTVGLWATDKPKLIPENVKHLFFEITK